jgi:predicted metal-dependent phosphoesterase TrpH
VSRRTSPLAPTGAVVDLHLHTTASDGRLSPRQLVEQAVLGGVSIMAVTDHDTTAAVAEVSGVASARGVEAISGIEITSVEHGRDVHILGYFLNPDHPALTRFLVNQRAARVARAEAIADRLAALGMPIDVAPLLAEVSTQSGRSIGRPQIARAMVAAGHVADVGEAFARWLGQGRPGFIARQGTSPERVIDIIHQAGGLASVAHPGKTAIDARIPALASAGLDALEAYHPDHDPAMVTHYVALARTHRLLLTGGSDFHGDPSHGRFPGSVPLPSDEWGRLRDARR